MQRSSVFRIKWNNIYERNLQTTEFKNLEFAKNIQFSIMKA